MKEKFLKLVLPNVGKLHPDYIDHLTEDHVARLVAKHGSVEAAAKRCLELKRLADEQDSSYYGVAWLQDWGFM